MLEIVDCFLVAASFNIHPYKEGPFLRSELLTHHVVTEVVRESTDHTQADLGKCAINSQ